MNELDRKILHSMVHFQGTIMYALFHLTDNVYIQERLAKRMQDANALMKEINVDLQREHDALMEEVTGDLKNTPKN